MEFITQLRKDLKLRSFAIYAQWFGVFAAIVHLTTALWGLSHGFIYWRSLLRFDFGLFHQVKPLKLIMFVSGYLNTLILPLGPLVLEIPHLYFRFPWAIKAFGFWEFFIMMRQIIENFMILASGGRGKPTSYMISVVVSMALCTVTISLIQVSTRRVKDLDHSPTVTPKIVFYTTLAVVFVLTSGYPYYARFQLPLSLWVLPATRAVLYLITILLYSCAWYWGHGAVSSRVLGGSGVEPIALEFPGRASGSIAL